MNAKEIFEKLVQRAGGFFASSSLRRRPHGKPGEMVENLSPEEREELKNLTSKDINKDVDRGILWYMSGAYPENTTTIHTHSVKEEDESDNSGC